MNEFECYTLYVALKNHFTKNNYDFFKYNGKSRIKASSLKMRNDKVFFQKLAKHDDPFGFLVSNLVYNPKLWIKEIAYSEEAQTRYDEWIKRNQALSYTFRNELSKLKDDFNLNFTVDDYDHPYLLKLYLRKEILLETLIMLVDITGCSKLWNKKMDGDPSWDNVNFLINKYKPFMNYEKEKISKIVLDKFG